MGKTGKKAIIKEVGISSVEDMCTVYDVDLVSVFLVHASIS